VYGYVDDDPLLVGEHALVKLWLAHDGPDDGSLGIQTIALP
jgi:hypothetical protein